MGRPRLELQRLFKTMTEHVYFQPPNGLLLKYPCIVYRRDYASKQYADNVTWRRHKRYQVTVMDTDPDSLIPEKVAELPMCEQVRWFAVDDLNHDVFNLYF